ncbi:MAG: ankyrin repeat domain-containing protein [Candidatus Margulisbacteria bacterium]|nr:ankyrin repeat domain-containing protein [Candidatus Margulisiibacteriota bacterium]
MIRTIKRKITALQTETCPLVFLKEKLAFLEQNLNIFMEKYGMQIVNGLMEQKEKGADIRNLFPDIKSLHFLYGDKPDVQDHDPVQLAQRSIYTCLEGLNEINKADILRRLQRDFQIMGFHTVFPDELLNKLYKSIMCGDIDELKRLLDMGISVNTKIPESISQRSHNVLTLAVEYGDLFIIEEILHRGPDLNIKDKKGDTAFLKAARWGQYSCAKKIMAAGVDLDEENNEGQSALILAVLGLHLQMVRDLIEAGADVNHSDVKGDTVLHHLIRKGFPSTIIDMLKSRGAKLDEYNYEMLSPLMLASTIPDREEQMEFLIAAGANINKTDNMGRPAVYLAIEKNNMEALQLLLDKGANVNFCISTGVTPLDLAYFMNNQQAVRMLEAAGVVYIVP